MNYTKGVPENLNIFPRANFESCYPKHSHIVYVRIQNRRNLLTLTDLDQISKCVSTEFWNNSTKGTEPLEEDILK